MDKSVSLQPYIIYRSSTESILGTGLRLQLYLSVVSSIKSMTSVAVILFTEAVATADLDVQVLMVGIITEAAAEISKSCEDDVKSTLWKV